jgi:general secretion pathway protein L
MKAFPAAAEAGSRWIDAVAASTRAVLERFGSAPTVKLVEQEAGEFVLQTDRGSSAVSIPQQFRIVDGRLDHESTAILADILPDSRVELILQPQRFLFRPLELPSRASEFLNGIVRSQIDRLTPWSAADAAFGWSKPVDAGADRMTITIASTALALIKPFVQAIAGMGAHSISVFALPVENGPGANPIKVWEESARQTLDIGQIRRALIIILATAAIAAGVSIGASAVVGANLDAQQSDLMRQIAIARTKASAMQAAASDSVSTVQLTLAKHKHDVPSTVMVLETLSRILPDHTYVTELRVEGDKLRLVGVTRDAPSLVGLFEQSGHFTKATFFAPTTRSDSTPGEIFHIETVVQPISVPRS